MALNIRPEAVDLFYYPGNSITLTVDFPTGYLSTRVIKSFLNGRAVSGLTPTGVEATVVEVTAQQATITFSGAQTNTFDYPVVWEMDLFDSPSTYTVLLTGLWSPGTDGSDGPSTGTYSVTISPSLTVTVTAVSVTSSLPTGGTTGQVLTKASGTDYDADWETPTALSLGSTTNKSTDAAGPFTLAAGSVHSTITEAIMDGTFGGITGVAWSNADDRFNVTTGGLFFCSASFTLDSSVRGSFAGSFDAYFVTNDDTVACQPAPYGSGIDIDYYLNATLYIPAGSYLRLSARSQTVSVNITYAELLMRRLS